MPPPSRTDELPIIRAYYEFILWLTPKMGKFPREHRFTLGQGMERLLCEILEKLIRAKFTRGRVSLAAKRRQAIAWDASPRKTTGKNHEPRSGGRRAVPLTQ